MSDKEKDLLPEATNAERAIDAAAVVTSIVPWLGGPVSVVLGGMSNARKLRRVGEVLQHLSEELESLESEASRSYVKTEDFEELLENALRRASEERNEELRSVYGEFLRDAIQSPGEPYDEQLRFLRTLEQLQPDHLVVLKAMTQEPGRPSGMMTGSPLQTLKSRIEGMSDDRISDLVAQLNDLRLLNLTSLKVMMTAQGAQDLRGSVTPYGNRFARYLVEA